MLKAKMKGQKLKNKNGNTLETSIKFQKTKNRTIEHFENANYIWNTCTGDMKRNNLIPTS